jgi:uncharacterized protein YjbI with pentapeptide repeats
MADSKDYSFQNLRKANLRNADLRFANLQHANLQEADLRGAKLEGANLEDADLRVANLRGANLQEADLRYAKFYYADLREADLRGAKLEGANLRHAWLFGANLDGALIDYQIEEGLLLKVARAALVEGALDMSAWRTCDTAHSIARWAEVLSEKTRALAATHGYEVAGLLTLGAEAQKYFYASNDDARKFLQSIVDANG